MVPQFCSRTATHTNWGWNRDYRVKLGPKRQGDFKDNSIIFFGWVRISFVFFVFFVFLFLFSSLEWFARVFCWKSFLNRLYFPVCFPRKNLFWFSEDFIAQKKKTGKTNSPSCCDGSLLTTHTVPCGCRERERKGAREREREREREFEDEMMMMMMRKKKNPFRELSRILLQRNNCSSPVLMSSGLSLHLL